MRTDAIFAIGSITKQFAAAAILQLRDQGKLGLDDDITKWLPDFDTRGARIRLRRLLCGPLGGARYSAHGTSDSLDSDTFTPGCAALERNSQPGQHIADTRHRALDVP